MFKTHQTTAMLLGCTCLMALAAPAAAAIEYDQNVTNETIWGSGNVNGSFTTDRANGVELGLRAKLRHNATGQPENTFNSNGDGTYSFAPGVAPTQSSPTAVWSFEWSINSNYDATTTRNLNDLTYQLSMTSTTGASIVAFDPINGVNPAVNVVAWDHSIGTNATGNGAGTEANSAATYAALIDGNNLAQNSWKPHWYAINFDPTDTGTYTFVLSAFDGVTAVASTTATVLVPEPSAFALLGLGAGALLLRRRRQRN